MHCVVVDCSEASHRHPQALRIGCPRRRVRQVIKVPFVLPPTVVPSLNSGESTRVSRKSSKGSRGKFCSPGPISAKSQSSNNVVTPPKASAHRLLAGAMAHDRALFSPIQMAGLKGSGICGASSACLYSLKAFSLGRFRGRPPRTLHLHVLTDAPVPILQCCWSRSDPYSTRLAETLIT